MHFAQSAPPFGPLPSLPPAVQPADPLILTEHLPEPLGWDHPAKDREGRPLPGALAGKPAARHAVRFTFASGQVITFPPGRMPK